MFFCNVNIQISHEKYILGRPTGASPWAKAFQLSLRSNLFLLSWHHFFRIHFSWPRIYVHVMYMFMRVSVFPYYTLSRGGGWQGGHTTLMGSCNIYAGVENHSLDPRGRPINWNTLTFSWGLVYPPPNPLPHFLSSVWQLETTELNK